MCKRCTGLGLYTPPLVKTYSSAILKVTLKIIPAIIMFPMLNSYIRSFFPKDLGGVAKSLQNYARNVHGLFVRTNLSPGGGGCNGGQRSSCSCLSLSFVLLGR